MQTTRSGLPGVSPKPKPSQADLEALCVAGKKMQQLISEAGTTEDEIVSDFKELRRERSCSPRIS